MKINYLLPQTYAEFTSSTGADLMKYRDECVSKFEIPPETVEQYKKWMFTDDKSACYIHCIFEKMNLYADDDFLVDNLAIQLSHGEGDPETLKEGINACIDKTQTDNCQKAFKGFSCFKENHLYMIKKSVD
jgi:hypothetical protein